nr:spore coat protein U domain-containing protein [uncultured Ralstonia sp.]
MSVTGRITGTCSISSGSTLAFTLDPMDTGAFGSVGATGGQSAAQNIVLTCQAPPGVTMRMTGTGAGSGAPDSVLANAAGTDAATGVGIQLLYHDGAGAPATVLRLNTDVALTRGTTVTIPVAARYYALVAKPTAGTVNSTATLNFTFN